MSEPRVKTIAVLGAGFSGAMCAAALSARLPKDIKIYLIDVPGADETDLFFGTTTSPSTYDFLLKLGLTEPDILPQSNTAFSLGTHYIAWGRQQNSWTQVFSRPLPIINGVQFQHYLNRIGQPYPQLDSLSLYIMAAHAARRGVFAHPPGDRQTPLSDVEYGYQFLPRQWRKLFLRTAAGHGVEMAQTDVANIKADRASINTIRLSTGQILKADLYIDCLGQKLNILGTSAKGGTARKLQALETIKQTPKLGPVCRKLSGASYGWQSETSLQDGQHRLTVYHPSSDAEALAAHGGSKRDSVEISVGFAAKPWHGNVVTLGHGAAALEPLTAAPVTLLQRDIERLIELIPVSLDMQVEAREYNRRFADDYDHAAMFQRAFFGIDSVPTDTSYWKAARSEEPPAKLIHKITQFENRGITVQYDLEPFDSVDWLQLHTGLGRRPQRFDPLANRMDERELIETLQQMRGAIETMASKMPPHHVYMAGLLKYLRKKHG